MMDALAEPMGDGITGKLLHDFLWKKRAPPDDVRAALVMAFFPRLRPQSFLGWTSPEINSTIRTMSATEFAQPIGPGRPKARKNHNLIAALERKRTTLVAEGKRVKRSPASIRSFCYPENDPSYRPCPRKLADYWRKTYGVPLSTWPRIQD